MTKLMKGHEEEDLEEVCGRLHSLFNEDSNEALNSFSRILVEDSQGYHSVNPLAGTLDRKMPEYSNTL